MDIRAKETHRGRTAAAFGPVRRLGTGPTFSGRFLMFGWCLKGDTVIREAIVGGISSYIAGPAALRPELSGSRGSDQSGRLPLVWVEARNSFRPEQPEATLSWWPGKSDVTALSILLCFTIECLSQSRTAGYWVGRWKYLLFSHKHKAASMGHPGG